MIRKKLEAHGGSGGSPTGDTHAADVQGGTSDRLAQVGGTTAVSDPTYGADVGITETIINTVTITPAQAQNANNIVGCFRAQKKTNTGTCTLRLKEGAVTLVSSTSGSLAVDAFDIRSAQRGELDVSVAAHTYDMTIQFSTDGGLPGFNFLYGRPFNAVLTGGPGTCPP